MPGLLRRAAPTVGSVGSPGLPSLVQQTALAGPVQGWGQGLCVIPELVRKPGPAWLILSPAVGSQARDPPILPLSSSTLGKSSTVDGNRCGVTPCRAQNSLH